MKNIAITTLLSFAGFFALAQPASYSTASIPDSLLKNAHAVVRYYDAYYKITSPEEYALIEKLAVTVLDEKGKKYSDLKEPYSKWFSIESAFGTLYNKEGVAVAHTKKKDIIDVAQFGESFVDDDRIKIHSFGNQPYPYTTVYEVEKRFKTTLFIRSWDPIPGPHCSLEQASLHIDYPLGFPLRYKTIKLTEQPTVKSVHILNYNHDEKHNEMALSLWNVKATIEADDFTAAVDQRLPSLTLVADSFSIFGYSGSMATWKDMGLFFYNLNKDRDILTPQVKAAVHQLIDTCRNDKSKIKVLYNYLQKNTRYVSIQMGIGGWQTFDAVFVCEKKYGDCKALSNFMHALLKEAGITSYAAKVKAGRTNRTIIDEHFPAHFSNHIIVCVPLRDDTTWLECTSPDLPAGYLGEFTSNRNVLLNTPQGGVFVKTPNYGLETNILKRKAELSLNENDELIGKVMKEFKGSFWENEYHQVINESTSNIDKHLNTSLGYKNYRVTQPVVEDFSKDGAPLLKEELQVAATTEATRSGNNLILSTGIFSSGSPVSSRADTVSSFFQLYKSAVIIDTVVINLNADYAFSTPFKETTSEYPFGSYSLNYSLLDKRRLIRTSTYTIKEGVYPADQFKNFRKQSNEAGSSSKSKIVLTKL